MSRGGRSVSHLSRSFGKSVETPAKIWRQLYIEDTKSGEMPAVHEFAPFGTLTRGL